MEYPHVLNKLNPVYITYKNRQNELFKGLNERPETAKLYIYMVCVYVYI